MKKTLCILFLFFSFFYLTAQVKIGQWVDYLAYNSVFSVAKGNGKIYAATGNGMFSFNLSDNSLERLNKIYSLNDVGANLVRFNNYNNTLIIVYSNSNIDVIKNGVVTNFSDIKRKNITSAKTVYNISFYHEFAYLSTAFGIVVFDTDKFEFKDTYVIGNNGTFLAVYDLATDGNTLYAATPLGLKQANVSLNLSDYQNWNNAQGLPLGEYNFVTICNNRYIANHSYKLQTGASNVDTMYWFDGNAWATFPKNSIGPGQNYEIKSLLVDEASQKIVLVDQWDLEEWSFNGTTFLRSSVCGGNLNFLDQNGNGIWPATMQGVYAPELGQNTYFLATTGLGLIKTDGVINEQIIIDGPDKSFVSQIAIQDNKVIIAPVWLTEIWYNQYKGTGIYTFSDGSWKNIMKNPLTSTAIDINCIAFLNKNPNHYFAGTWGGGVCEFRNDTLFTIHNQTNSSLLPAQTTTNSVRVNGIVSDTLGNLWVSNAFRSEILSVRKPTGVWQNFNFGALIPNNSLAGKIIIDKNNQKWILVPGTGLIVYNDGANYTPPITTGANKNTKLVNTTVGNGALPSATIYTMCEDLEGDIWVGTDKGIAVFYNPESILSSYSGWDAQQIIIEQNGVAQILLLTETIFDIAIDGQNRKWVATKNGVFCLSADGQTEYYHFTIENSPLFSNTVVDLEYNGKTGDLFIGTLEGLQSFRTDVIDAFEEFTEVYSYPNPVKPDYEGPIVIKGMVANTVVKITDITGALVYETKSKGGQAIWYAKNFKGERVASGVYVVFCASSDGEKKVLTKILVVN